MPELGVADVPVQAPVVNQGLPFRRGEDCRRWGVSMAADLLHEGLLNPVVDPKDGSDVLDGGAAIAWYADRLAAFAQERQQAAVDALQALCRARSTRYAQGAVQLDRLLGDARLLIDYVRTGP
jgi:hypothetical protein